MDMERIIRLHARLLEKGSSDPLTGEDYRVRFYDNDIIKDDYLGESTLDGFGHAIVPVTRSDFRSADSPLEKYPDIYFTLVKDGKIIYKSPVCKNLHLEEIEDFPASGGLHCDLGTFVV